MMYIVFYGFDDKPRKITFLLILLILFIPINDLQTMPSNFFQRAFTRLLLVSRRQSGPMTRVAITGDNPGYN